MLGGKGSTGAKNAGSSNNTSTPANSSGSRSISCGSTAFHKPDEPSQDQSQDRCTVTASLFRPPLS